MLAYHFNTSHVNVNQRPKVNSSVFLEYFNTSHVNVNLYAGRIERRM